MRKTNLLRRALLFVVIAPLSMCGGPIEPGSRGLCEKCGSDEHCEAGLTCRLFTNPSFATELCAGPGTTSCSLR